MMMKINQEPPYQFSFSMPSFYYILPSVSTFHLANQVNEASFEYCEEKRKNLVYKLPFLYFFSNHIWSYILFIQLSFN